MSSFAATMTSGGLAMPASADSVIARPLARSKPAVSSKTILYLSFAVSSTLCRPLLRSIAGLDAGLSLQVHDGRAVREELHDQLALRFAALDVVGADMGENAGNLVDAPVDGDDRNAGVDRLLQRRRHGVDLVRADDDAVDALGDRRLDVGGLLRRRTLTVAFDRR